MLRSPFAGLDRKTLRWWLLLFFLALAIPTAILVRQAYSELKWESFHHYRLMAEELAARIDNRFMALVSVEEAHAFADYSFPVIRHRASCSVHRCPIIRWIHPFRD